MKSLLALSLPSCHLSKGLVPPGLRVVALLVDPGNLTSHPNLPGFFPRCQLEHRFAALALWVSWLKWRRDKLRRVELAEAAWTYLEDILVSSQLVGLPSQRQRDDRQRGDLLTGDHILK